jgi:hypothetical protein
MSRGLVFLVSLFIPLLSHAYTLGGAITGFTGSSSTYLILRLNSTTSRIVAANTTSYRFSTQFQTSSPYNIVIAIQPAGLRCTIINASGVFQTSNITNANITCVPLVSAQVSWTLPTQNTDGTALTDLTSYILYYGTDPTFTTKASKLISAPALSTTVTNLAKGSTYYFAISSVSASGGVGPRSNAATYTP